MRQQQLLRCAPRRGSGPGLGPRVGARVRARGSNDTQGPLRLEAERRGPRAPGRSILANFSSSATSSISPSESSPAAISTTSWSTGAPSTRSTASATCGTQCSRTPASVAASRVADARVAAHVVARRAPACAERCACAAPLQPRRRRRPPRSLSAASGTAAPRPRPPARGVFSRREPTTTSLEARRVAAPCGARVVAGRTR